MPVENRRPELQEVLDRAIDRRLRAARTALPGIVDSYDATKQLATVVTQLAETATQLDGTEAPQPAQKISDVPVLFPGANGFRLTFPVKQGDRVMLLISDRSMDELKTKAPALGKTVTAADVRHHALSDAVALVGFHDLVSVWSSAPTDRLSLGLDGGNAAVEVTSSQVNIGKNADQPITRFTDLKSVEDAQTHIGNLGYPTGTPLVPLPSNIGSSIGKVAP